MPTRRLRCPIVIVAPLGSGRFARVTEPAQETHVVLAPKAILYGAWDQARGTRCTILRRLDDDHCIVQVTDNDSGLVDWATLLADPEITDDGDGQ